VSLLYLSLKPVLHQNEVSHRIQLCKSVINLTSILVLVTNSLLTKLWAKGALAQSLQGQPQVRNEPNYSQSLNTGKQETCLQNIME